MKHRMSLSARKELVASLSARYTDAKRKEKQRILDEFIAVTNYHRKYAIAVLKIGPQEKSPQAVEISRQRRRLYTSEGELPSLLVPKESVEIKSSSIVFLSLLG